MKKKDRIELTQAIREIAAQLGVIMSRDQMRRVRRILIEKWYAEQQLKNETKPLHPNPEPN